MARSNRKPLAEPEETHRLGRGQIQLVQIGETTVGHSHFPVGWRWSIDVQPIVGTASCEFRHLGYCLQGQMHVRDDSGGEIDIGPGDVYEIPPGHDAWIVGDEPYESVEFASSRNFTQADGSQDRDLATILFTDIVDSTRRLSEIGDQRWRNVLLDHNRDMRAQLDAFRGREVSTTGDGFVALFDSPVRGARCARAMTEAAVALGIEIRAGVHTGEVERAGESVRGVAVHLAARVMALGGPSDVLISATTAELLAGSGLELEKLGPHELKGVPGAREIFRLRA